MDVLLIYPPFISTSGSPPSGIPALAAYIKKYKYKVSQLDLNVIFFWYIIENWEEFNSLVENELKDYASQTTLEIKQRDQIYKVLNIDIPIINKLRNDLLEIQGLNFRKNEKNKYYYIELLQRSIHQIVNIFFFKNIFLFNDYLNVSVKDYSEDILNSARSSFINTFLKRYIPSNVKTIGFSLIGDSQLPFTLLLANLISITYPKVKIVAGGAYITEVYKKLIMEDSIYEYFDYIVAFEGETAILDIIGSNNGSNLKHSNVFTSFISDVGREIVVEEINNLPTQYFNGLNLDLYWPWGLSLPMYSSKGCTWKRCNFCNFNYKEYREIEIDKLLNSLSSLYQETKINRFQFVDEDINPERLRKLAILILENTNLNIEWIVQTRFYKDINYELLKLLKLSGLSTIQFGIESANQRISKLIRKGISLKNVKQILTDCEKLGINIILNFMIGFPSETEDEANSNLDFIDEIYEKHPHLNFSCNTQRVKIYEKSNFFLERDKFSISNVKSRRLSSEAIWDHASWVNPFIIKHKDHLLFSRKSSIDSRTSNLIELVPHENQQIRLSDSLFIISDIADGAMLVKLLEDNYILMEIDYNMKILISLLEHGLKYSEIIKAFFKKSRNLTLSESASIVENGVNQLIQFRGVSID